jgi:hypothetical protein
MEVESAPSISYVRNTTTNHIA